MAQTPLRHRLTLPRPQWDADDVARQAAALWTWTRSNYARDPRLFLWRLLWLPFWIGGDAPAARLPSRTTGGRETAPTDPAGQHLTVRIDRITRRFGIAWIAGSALRGLTLALLILTLWTGCAVAGLGRPPGWQPAAGLAIAGLALGAGYGWLARPDRLMVAGMLDRTFGLRERIVTAFDRPVDPRHVSRLQLADAANTFDEVSLDLPRSTFLPIREAALCLIVTGALVTVLLAHVPRQPLATVNDAPVPQFVPASERLAVREQPAPPAPVAEQPPADQASIAEIQERGRQSASAREDLARLGAALQEHPITRPAAESIASGDYASAAESLRAASASAGAMTPDDREALADDLDAAAEEISEENPELAQAANNAASALREGGPVAETALENLASQVEATGDEVESPDDLARDLDETQDGAGEPSSSSSDGSQGESSGESQSQSAGESDAGNEPGAASDPGEGSAAQPGVANQPQESGESAAGSGESDSGGEPGGEGSSSEGAGEAPSDAPAGEGDGSGEPSSEAAGSEGQGSGSTLEGAPDDETSASQGSGAGTGQRGANDQNTSDQDVADPAEAGQENPEAEVPGAGEAGDPPPSRADRGEADDGAGTSSQGSANLELEGVSDSGVQTGGDSGSSSLGSGSGSTTASGDEIGGQVGVAGPDSNRAPDDLRDVVRDFFGGPEE